MPSLPDVRRFATFLVTGGVAAVVNVVSRWLLDFVVIYEVAVTLAYLCGMITAFALARMFVFKSADGSMHGQFVRFALVNGVAFAQVFFVSEMLARLIFPTIGFTWQAATVAHVIGVASPVASSYVLHKRYSFRSSAI
jgi:putative flippase GtrA